MLWKLGDCSELVTEPQIQEDSGHCCSGDQEIASLGRSFRTPVLCVLYTWAPPTSIAIVLERFCLVAAMSPDLSSVLLASVAFPFSCLF